jgi:hypothetical protein
MNLIESVIFTILGGLVVGRIGYFATILSLIEQRKEMGVEKYKTNHKPVSISLDQMFADTWIFVFGPRQLKFPTHGQEMRRASVSRNIYIR